MTQTTQQQYKFVYTVVFSSDGNLVKCLNCTGKLLFSFINICLLGFRSQIYLPFDNMFSQQPAVICPDLKNSKVLIDSSTTLHNTTPFCPPTRKPALPRYNFLLPSHLKNPSPVFRPNLLSATIFSNNSMASGA